jgi:hypothetical protein
MGLPPPWANWTGDTGGQGGNAAETALVGLVLLLALIKDWLTRETANVLWGGIDHFLDCALVKITKVDAPTLSQFARK